MEGTEHEEVTTGRRPAWSVVAAVGWVLLGLLSMAAFADAPLLRRRKRPAPR